MTNIIKVKGTRPVFDVVIKKERAEMTEHVRRGNPIRIRKIGSNLSPVIPKSLACCVESGSYESMKEPQTPTTAGTKEPSSYNPLADLPDKYEHLFAKRKESAEESEPGQTNKRFAKKFSLFDKAIGTLKERHHEKNFNRLIDNEYNIAKDLADNGIAFLGQDVHDKYKEFDNIARNMNHFVYSKLCKQ